ncbi:MAG: hypothetical protein WBQ18_17035 [Solirubrobacteraceae bacterium]
MPTAYICVTCGVQYAPSDEPPDRCAICDEPRQYVGRDGQQWTTLQRLRADHGADLREEEPGLLGIGVRPSFGIGQRALLVQGPAGNVLWDCVSLIDDEIVAAVQRAGGVAAIAISHPHYYASMVEWAQRFDAPVHLHEADRKWVMRPDERVQFWSGETLALRQGVTLLRLGGHFPGATVAHWAAGCAGRGALLSGDTVTVVQDRRWVGFMRSYPNLIPLPADDVRRIAATLAPHAFERIYGAWYGRVVAADGAQAVARSAERYVRALAGDFGESSRS